MGSLVWGVGVTLWGLLVALVAVPLGRDSLDRADLEGAREPERSL